MNPRIFLLALGTFALGTDAFVMAGVLPAIGHDLNITVDTAGQLVTIFSLTYGLGAPLLAALTSSIGRRRLLITALFVFALANVCSAISPNFAILMLTRVLAASCAAIYSPTSYTVAVTLAPPQKRGQALAIVIAGLTVSTVVGVPLGTLIGSTLNWRMTFGLVAILAIVAGTILVTVGLPEMPNPPAIKLAARLAPIKRPLILAALSVTFIWSAGSYILYTYVSPLLQQNLHVSNASGLLLVYGVGAMIGSWFGGYAADHFGLTRPMVFGIIALTVVLATLPLATNSIVTGVIALFLWGMFGWSLFPVQQSRLLTLAPEHSNVILALNNSALYLGIAAGSGIGGIVLQVNSVQGLGPVGAVCEVLALALLTFVLRNAPVVAPVSREVREAIPAE